MAAKQDKLKPDGHATKDILKAEILAKKIVFPKIALLIRFIPRHLRVYTKPALLVAEAALSDINLLARLKTVRLILFTRLRATRLMKHVRSAATAASQNTD